MRLLAVEVRRIRARRLVLLVVLAGLGAIALVLAGTWQSARPLTDAQIEDAERQYAFALEDWEANGEQMVADCLEQQERESELTGGPVDFGCEQMGPPQEEWFLPQANELAQTFVPLLSSTATLLVLLVFAIGVTSTAAEMSSGSMSTWLTFVPQRMRVLFSKVGAAVLVGLPLTLLLVLVLVAGLVGVHAANDALGDLTGEVWTDVAWTVLRIVLLGGVVAGVGAALGVLLRHTGVALGVVLGYAVVVEAILGSLVTRLQPFLLRTTMTGWIEGGTSYWVNECTVTERGTECMGTEVPVSLLQSSLVLVVAVAVVLGVTALVFRRRDVG